MCLVIVVFCFFNVTPPTELYTLSLHDALPIWPRGACAAPRAPVAAARGAGGARPALDRAARATAPLGSRRSEEHTSELQSLRHLVCRLLLEKKKKEKTQESTHEIPTHHHYTMN